MCRPRTVRVAGRLQHSQPNGIPDHDRLTSGNPNVRFGVVDGRKNRLHARKVGLQGARSSDVVGVQVRVHAVDQLQAEFFDQLNKE